MRGQHARGAGVRLNPRLADLTEKRAQIIGAAGDRCWTECRDTVAHERRRDVPYGMATIEGVVSVDAMDVDVDEPGYDIAAGHIDDAGSRRFDPCGLDGFNTSAVEEQRAFRQHPIRKNEIAAHECDHGPSQSTWT